MASVAVSLKGNAQRAYIAFTFGNHAEYLTMGSVLYTARMRYLYMLRVL